MRLLPLAFVLVLAAAGCGREPVPEPSATAPVSGEDVPPGAAAEAVDRLAEAFFEDQLALYPLAATFMGDDRYNDRLAISIGPEHRARQKALYERTLADLQAIPGEGLEGQALLTREVLRAELVQGLAALEFPSHLLPVNQLFSMPSVMAMLGSGASAQPFADAGDYEAFLSRMDDFSVWVDQAIANMREGIRRGIVQPRPVVEQVVTQLDSIAGTPAEESLFWGPVRNLPGSVDADQAEQITAAWRDKLESVLLPAYTRLADFVREEYLPAARETVGWSALPGGEDWYAFRVRSETTTSMDPEAIHRLGLSEVSRIRTEMDRVRREVGFEGDLQAFFEHLRTDPRFRFSSREAVLEAFRGLKDRIDAALPRLFSDFPEADYEVRPVEAFREDADAAGSYQRPPADNSRPGIFYVNTKLDKAQPTFATETLALHEAAPGHHFQGAIAQELTDLPRIRRFGGFTAYVEGWALYAESLGPALGMFQDPYQYFGRLNDEQLRAMRLVVDTGLHAMGWSREEAIRYMQSNSALPDGDIVSEVDRYIATPGQALSYKLGELKLHELRRRAEAALGDDFDIKAWHSMILRGGALPLDVLEGRNQRWIEARRPGV
ncbi:MAG: DUF885 domain-containing protein [Gammaproteobacteria bacterium]